jgi:S1-C subfamily serine protease
MTVKASFGIRRVCGVAAVALAMARTLHAATPTPEMQKAAAAATFEVVVRKVEPDPLSYERPLPLELIPYVLRNDKYWSVGTAFALGPDTYVSAAHVLLGAVGSQFGAPSLRDAAGHVYAVNRILKFSLQEDFAVFTVAGAPPATPLPIAPDPRLNEVVYAVGNALGEGVVMRDGLLTSETPEDQEGRWKWLRFSAAVSPGNSGGPLLDADGKVIGVVRAKSANENLNYALPISRVQDATAEQAEFDLRYSIKLPNARHTEVATLKEHFDLPKSFAEFSQSYLDMTLRTDRRDLLQLQTSMADSLFPKGDSTKLLATVYDSPLPTFIQQAADDSWDALAADNVFTKDLPGNGLISVGTSLSMWVFRVRRPAGASDDTFYRDPKHFTDLLLQGLKLPRTIGDQSIRITSLGNAQRERVVDDQFGRHWQMTAWPLGYVDVYLLCFALPVPEGYVGIAAAAPATQLDLFINRVTWMLNEVEVNYSGTLDQWKAFLARRDMRPKLFDDIKVEFDSNHGLHYESPRLTMQLPADLIEDPAHGTLEMNTSYVLSNGKLRWDAGALYYYKDQARHSWIGLERHVRPADDTAGELLETWKRMSVRGPGFNGTAGHDEDFKNYWIHDAISAATAQHAGIDPAATVLYDIGYTTDAEVYPRKLEDIERRLIHGVHILER